MIVLHILAASIWGTVATWSVLEAVSAVCCIAVSSAGFIGIAARRRMAAGYLVTSAALLALFVVILWGLHYLLFDLWGLRFGTLENVVAWMFMLVGVFTEWRIALERAAGLGKRLQGAGTQNTERLAQ